jgi:hypothetical protein
VNPIKNKVLQISDVWSLGCVLSVAATFVVLGSQGVRLYQSLRTTAIARLKNSTTTAGDSFHDGSNVLGCVLEWHRYLRSIRRCSDLFTRHVLDMIDEMMLQPEAGRSNAKQVEDCFIKILGNVSDGEDFPEVQAFLQAIDIEAESVERDINLPSISVNSEPKSQLEESESNHGVEKTPCRSSEDMIRSISIQPTSKRNLHRPMSTMQDGSKNKNLRRVYSDPREVENNSNLSQSRSGHLSLRIQALSMTPDKTEDEEVDGELTKMKRVRNWCEVEEALQVMGKDRSLKNLKFDFSRGKLVGVKKALNQIYRGKEKIIKGLAEDDALDGYFINRDIVSTCKTIFMLCSQGQHPDYL